MSNTELLIKTLLHQARLHNKQGANGLGLLFTNAAQEIEKLQSENAELKKQSQWIRVEDELPPIEQEVFIFPSIDSSDTHYIASFDGESFVKYFDSGFGVERACSDFVTHWMPLPTPPEGE